MLFSYEAIDKDGRKVRGSYNAGDKNQVVAYLRAQRMQPVKISNGKNTDLSSMLPQSKTKAKDSGLCLYLLLFFYAIIKRITQEQSLQTLIEVVFWNNTHFQTAILIWLVRKQEHF